MITSLYILALIVGFYMAWSIGANDVSNAMGTSVGSGALTLRQAVLIAAVLEFTGAYFFGSHVSETVQKDIISPQLFVNEPMTLVYGMISALVAAGVWLQIATYKGWPVSTTHSIIGAIVGFAATAKGIQAVSWGNVASIALSWIISPLIGGLISFTIFTILRKQIFYSSHPVRAAKKIAPILVFALVTFLSLAMLIKGLKNISLNLSTMDSILLSLSIGGLSGGICHIFTRRIVSEEISQPEEELSLNPKMLKHLEKAQTHLQKARTLAVEAPLRADIKSSLNTVEDISENIFPSAAKHSDSTHAKYEAIEKIFARMQLLSASFMAFAHGANDVANAIGPLAATLQVLETGIVSSTAPIPSWILALGGFGIICGLATWGWRVIETIGKNITALTPSRGFSAEFGATITIVVSSAFGFPVSTTHTLVGCVFGVGLARGIGSLNVGTIRDIVVSWVITFPAGAAIAIAVFYLLQTIYG
jgi:PiT family inorganic phosphate transporter